MKESRYREIQEAPNLLNRGETSQEGLRKFFDKQKRLIPSKLAEAEEFDGCSCIFCTRSLPKEEMARLYFDKDLVEKAFHTLKGITNLPPVRHWLSNRVKAPILMGYRSYLLLSRLKYRLKHIKISPQAALRELDTMYKVYWRDPKKGFKISRVVTLSKKQEVILKAIHKKLLECR